MRWKGKAKWMRDKGGEKKGMIGHGWSVFPGVKILLKRREKVLGREKGGISEKDDFDRSESAGRQVYS